MKKMKRTISLILSLSMCLVFVLTALISSGVTVSLAKSSSTYTSELWLLCDYENGLSRGERFAISESGASPYAYETGTVYVPLDAMCKYKSASYTVSDDVVTVSLSGGSTAVLTVGSAVWSGGEFLLPVVKDGEDIYLSILSLNDVFGTKSVYNKDIGLVVFYEDYSASNSTLQNQIDTLGNLLFERPSADTVYSDLVSYSGSTDTHPRLLATSEDFDRLRAVMNSPTLEEDTFYSKLQGLLSSSLSAFTSYFTVNDSTGEVEWKSEDARKSVRQPYYIYDEHGNRLVGRTSYTYVDEYGNEITLTPGGSNLGDGYDYGGRSSVNSFTTKLKSLAFLWQMLGDDKYADAFYLLAVELGKWEHWGEGHFLNCADGSVEFAIGLDWIYHAFDDEPEKREEMAAILYEKGMMKGYYAIVCDSLYAQGSSSMINLSSANASSAKQYGTHAALGTSSASTYLNISLKAGTGAWRTINRTNNWQTVCGSGMILAALCLSEYEEYRDNATFVIEQYLLSLERCLLQYAPDGSYIESPGYWGYGTNTLMVTLAALKSSLGTTYGYEDIVGLYDSFYYTIGIADGEYIMWNYHDSGAGSVDYSSFYLASRMFDDPTLAYLRDGMLFEGGKSFTVMDALYYTEELSDGATPDDLPLDYNFKGIDTATFRSAYGEEEIYTGLHTGPNHVTHGDFDCGNFTLTMGGVKWVADPAPENYNVSGFWSSGEYGQRYHLYAKSIEGHSTVMIRNDPSLPLGQRYTTTSTDYATIDTFYSDELGGYAITDMTAEYGANCISGKRGVLLTNSRSTVVLQDEISFSSATDLAWVLNLQKYLFFSEDGKSIIAKATSVSGEPVQIRVTLISDNEDLRFRLMKTKNSTADGKYETVFPDTYTKTNNGDDLASDPVQRVIIEANGVTDFNVAVVFQVLGHEDEIVPYSYTAMDSWTTESDDWVKEANKDIDYGTDTPVIPYTPYALFRNANEMLASAFEKGDLALAGQILRDTADYLLSYDQKKQNIVAEAARYRAYRSQYNLLLRAANKAFEDLLFD